MLQPLAMRDHFLFYMCGEHRYAQSLMVKHGFRNPDVDQIETVEAIRSVSFVKGGIQPFPLQTVCTLNASMF